MNYKEILSEVKNLVGLAKEESVKETKVVDEVVLSTEEVADTKEVELAEDVVEEPKKEVEQVQVSFATSEELSQVKQELLSMIKALIEDKSDSKEADVPAKLSKDDVELSNIEEIVHSPEAKTEQKVQKSYINKQAMTTEQRVAYALNN